jgi:TonB family protein
MRASIAIWAVVIFSSQALSQGRQVSLSQPNQFEIGQRTFFDFGPPFNYYTLYVIRPAVGGASIDRIMMSPPGNVCLAPAKVEIAHASINDSPSALLGSKSVCSIPGKELHRELKRCKHCQVFSGANMVLRVQCGTQTRLIRSDVLEKDWFESAPKTPEHTSAFMRLLKQLDDAAGPGVMEKPMFEFPDEGKHAALDSNSVVLQDLGAGKFDELFEGAPDKPSDLYRAAQILPPAPTVQLLDSTPFIPEVFILPKYPPIARVANIEGQVTFTASVDSDGALTEIVFANGNKILQAAVQEALNHWKYPQNAVDQQMHGTIEFQLNCQPNSRQQ